MRHDHGSMNRVNFSHQAGRGDSYISTVLGVHVPDCGTGTSGVPEAESRSAVLSSRFASLLFLRYSRISRILARGI